MKTGQYPQELSDDESDLEFQRVVIDGLFPGPSPAAVVARILSFSDVLLKVYVVGGEIAYSHQRWGYSKATGTADNLSWWPLSMPINASQIPIFIQEFDFNPPHEVFQGDIIGFEFTHHPLP